LNLMFRQVLYRHSGLKVAYGQPRHSRLAQTDFVWGTGFDRIVLTLELAVGTCTTSGSTPNATGKHQRQFDHDVLLMGVNRAALQPLRNTLCPF